MGTKLHDATHTPGPWRAEGWENVCVNAANGDTIVLMPGASKNAALAEHKANAALIAAAPDLLAACKMALETFEQLAREDDDLAFVTMEWDAEPMGSLRAAIAKAEGGPQ